MIAMQNSSSAQEEEPWLPPGFRFHPTDEELVLFYLREKVHNSSFTDRSIGEADFNKCEPWDLPGIAKMGEKEWYLYSTRDRKYPTGMRTNRATVAGYWKTTGKDRPVVDTHNKQQRCLIGMKKTLVFYTGRAPKGQKTNWVMHEYRIEGENLDYLPKSSRDKWVLCRVFLKGPGGKKVPLSEIRGPPLPSTSTSSSSYLPSLQESPELTESKSNPGGLTEEIGISDYLPSMGNNYDLFPGCKQEPYLPLSDFYARPKDDPLARRHVSCTGSPGEDQPKQLRLPSYQPTSYPVNTLSYPGYLFETADCNRLARFPSESTLDLESMWAFQV